MPQQPLSAFIAQTFGRVFGAAKLDNQGGFLSSQQAPDYYAATYGPNAPGSGKAGQSFSVANPSAVTSSAALATTYLGLCLSNPAGSGVNLVPKRVNILNIVAAAGETALGLITGWSAAGVVTHTTPLNANIVANYVGAATASGSATITASKANVDSACTIVGTPRWAAWLATDPVATQLPTANYDCRGAIIIPPGGYLALGNLLASGASGFLGSIEWDEVAP